MKKLALLALVTVLFASCQKDNNTGTIKFKDNGINPYDCYVDGNYQFTVDGLSSQTVNVSIGSHSVEVIQKSGWILYQTDETSTINVDAGKTTDVTFP